MARQRNPDELPSLDRLKQLFSVAENGDLIRLVTVARGKHQTGEKAGYKSMYDYWRVSVDGQMIANHRIVWALTHGEWPSSLLDHINGNREDNRPCNLRLATNQQNSQNRLLHRRNKTGYRGVTYDRRSKKYRAEIMISQKHRHLGMFRTAEEAAFAYEKAAEQLFGEFYRPQTLSMRNEHAQI